MKFYFTCLAFLLICFGNAQNTSRDIDSIVRIINNTRHPNRLAAEKATLSLKYFIAGDIKKAKRFYNDALKEALIAKADSGIAALYHAKGTIFYYESYYDSALVYFEKALTIRKKIKDDVGILKSTGNIGSIYYMLGNLPKALLYYEETQNKEAALHYEEGKYFSINNLGSVYLRLRMSKKALSYFRKAEKIYLKNKAKEQLIYTYDGLSEVYSLLKKPDSALYFALKAMSIAKALNEKRSFSYSLNSVGILFMNEKQFDTATYYFNEGLLMARKLKDKRLEMTIYANLAAIEIEKNTSENAMAYIEKIAKLKDELHVTANQEDLAKLFAQYYYKRGDYKNAYDQIFLYDKYTDSLYNIEATGKITEMQEKYESEKKEKENQLLQLENTSYKNTRNFLLIIVALALAGITGAVIAYQKIKNTNQSLEIQKKLVEEKQKEILDSIHYARRIQFALLASDTLLKSHLPEHFVLFKPKDVVSGDFYWATPTPTGFLYITADCTGHGVPGAFMSLLNISKLNQIITENKVDRPDLVLNHVRTEIIKVLNPTGSLEESKDGMDAVLCKLDLNAMKLQYAAANNSFYIIRNNALLTCKADKMPVGKGHDDGAPFTYNEISLQKGDIIYTFTDGFADQFGGSKGKKFKYKQLEELLLSIHRESAEIQKQKLNEVFENWKGGLEQIDDVCIIGVKV